MLQALNRFINIPAALSLPFCKALSEVFDRIRSYSCLPV